MQLHSIRGPAANGIRDQVDSVSVFCVATVMHAAVVVGGGPRSVYCSCVVLLSHTVMSRTCAWFEPILHKPFAVFGTVQHQMDIYKSTSEANQTKWVQTSF